MNWKRTIVIIALLYMAGTIYLNGRVPVPGALVREPQVSNQSAQAGPELPGLREGSIVEIVDQAGPAVVKIDTVTPTAGNPFLDDPFFQEFFGPHRPPSSNPGHRGMGSGFLFSDDGYILTNEHVIHGAKEIWVTLIGYDRPLPAKVVGDDYDLDLAVLKVDAPRKLPYLKLGDSDKVRVGEWVIAIGNPHGLDHTVTVGVVSAKGRPVRIEDRYYDNLLQTDASINRGNSGGPLLNLRGEVVAINTAVRIEAQGIGFAIPTSTLRPVLDELVKTGRISHAWMGVQLRTVTPELAQHLGLKGGAVGAYVDGVVPNSPAAQAGLQPGDVIVKLDGTQVEDPDRLIRTIRTRKVGQNVNVTVFREGRTRDFQIELGVKPTRQELIKM